MGKPVLLWEPCYSLGNKTIVWVVRKVRTDILFADLVCFEVQCLPRSAHLKILRNFDDVVLNLRCIRRFKTTSSKLFYISFFLSVFFFASFFLLLSVFLHLTKIIFCRKRLCFLLFRRIGECISLDLFHQFCQPHQ